MKGLVLKMLLKQYLNENEVARLAKEFTNLVKLKYVEGIDPPTLIGLTVESPSGVVTNVVFKEAPKNWKQSGYKWKLNKNWFTAKLTKAKSSVKTNFNDIF